MDKETSHVSAILPTRPPSRRPSIIFKRQITRSKRCLRGPASLVDFDRIDQPVSLAEIKVLTLHVSLASWIAGQLCTALSLACVSVVPKFLVAGPFAADCVGEDADVVEEVLVGVTVVSRPAGLWCTPTGGESQSFVLGDKTLRNPWSIRMLSDHHPPHTHPHHVIHINRESHLSSRSNCSVILSITSQP